MIGKQQLQDRIEVLESRLHALGQIGIFVELAQSKLRMAALERQRKVDGGTIADLKEQLNSQSKRIEELEIDLKAKDTVLRTAVEALAQEVASLKLQQRR